MYYYIVDPQKISQREFERVQNLLYSSVSEYRVSGEIARVTGLRTIGQLVENALGYGATTIVAVGSDETLNDVINTLRGRDMVVGFIPILETEAGRILGIKNIEQAAKTLGGRRIAQLDLGRVNDVLFLSRLSFGVSQSKSGRWSWQMLQSLLQLPNFEIKLAADEQFQASLRAVGGMIVNSRQDDDDEQKISDPTDGILDVLLLPKLSKWQTFHKRQEILSGNFEKIPGSSVLHVKRLEILTPAGLPLRSGGRIIAKTPAKIEILPKALKIIVGKDRKF